MILSEEKKIFFERQKYREDNFITGRYYKLNFSSNSDTLNKISPIGICLYTNKKYHILKQSNLNIITDDLKKFEKNTNKDNKKGKFINENCWTVLNEMQNDAYFQHKHLIHDNVLFL
jgi:hypothetical protein